MALKMYFLLNSTSEKDRYDTNCLDQLYVRNIRQLFLALVSPLFVFRILKLNLSVFLLSQDIKTIG